MLLKVGAAMMVRVVGLALVVAAVVVISGPPGKRLPRGTRRSSACPPR
ncbi:MAG: hypothetical protein LC781_20480 [Actinobacteria bacterium]|nr:hypothetical protein [Actinomycetota bacterium]